MDHRRFAVGELGNIIPCPVCGTYTEYDGGRTYECPDCGETGFSPDMTPHHVFFIRR